EIIEGHRAPDDVGRHHKVATELEAVAVPIESRRVAEHRGIPVAEGPAAIDHDGVRGLPEIPPVVGILPRTASHISIAGSYLEFRTEPVGVTSDGRIVVACRVVIEVSEAVAILDQVVRCP